MPVFDPIPVALDAAAIAARLRVDPKRSGSERLDDLVSFAQSLIRARAVYAAAYVGARGEGTVEVAGVTFASPVLTRNLAAANKVFPYLITVGPELERAAGERGDLLRQYYLEGMADAALESAAGWLASRLEALHGVTGLANMSPGSLEDWPITEQSKLFSVLGDTERLVGVRLTDSLLMLPRKSISGILFPSEEGFVACRLCERELCPGRKADYEGGDAGAPSGRKGRGAR